MWNLKNRDAHSIPYLFRFSHSAFRLIPSTAAARLWLPRISVSTSAT